MVPSRNIKKIVKKKYSVTFQDKKDWVNFTKRMGNLIDKDFNLENNNNNNNKNKKIKLQNKKKINKNKNKKMFFFEVHLVLGT